MTLTGKRPPNRDPELQWTELVQDTKALKVQDTKALKGQDTKALKVQDTKKSLRDFKYGTSIGSFPSDGAENTAVKGLN